MDKLRRRLQALSRLDGAGRSQERTLALSQVLDDADALYYGHGTSPLSDFEYDQLLREYEELSGKPRLVVGSPTDPGLQTQRHEPPMLSLRNTYLQDELVEFVQRVQAQTNDEELPLVAELKYDGVALALDVDVRSSRIVRAVTRGNGSEGVDVTERVTSLVTPLEIKAPGEAAVDVLRMRGELVLARKQYATLQELGVVQRSTVGEHEYVASSRNTVVGALHRKTMDEALEGRLDFVAYALMEAESRWNVGNHTDALNLMDDMGLCTPVRSEPSHELRPLLRFVSSWASTDAREAYKYETDGVVLKVNALGSHAGLGQTARAPNWAVAFKYAPAEAESVLEEVEMQVGRSGRVTPVARVRPVHVGGALIQRASLHNHGHWRALNIHPGDRVRVVRAGQVIPQVFALEDGGHAGGSPGARHVLFDQTDRFKAWLHEQRCPCSRHEPLHWINDSVDKATLACRSVWCPEQQQGRLVHFASSLLDRSAGMGPARWKALVDAGLVCTFSQVVTLPEDVPLQRTMAEQSGFGTRSVQNLVASVLRGRAQWTAAQLLAALGIPGIGLETACALVGPQAPYASIAALCNDLDSIESRQQGIGPKRAQALRDFLLTEECAALLEQMADAGVACLDPNLAPALDAQTNGEEEQANQKWVDKVVVITGRFSQPRDAVKAVWRRRGARVVTSVSSNVDAVICGADPGARKLEAARGLGVPVVLWNEDEDEDLGE